MRRGATKLARMGEAIRDAYNDDGIPESYGRNTELLKAEAFILSYVGDEIENKAILDIGVGAGRTVPFLTALSNDYTGIDYSTSMLRYCRSRHAGVRLLQCDARKMDRFQDEAFDVVVATWNAIDDSDHNDRLKILNEVRRVLRAQGLFIFSSHNRDFQIRSAYRFRGFVSAPDPIQLIKRNAIQVKRYVTGILNHLDVKTIEIHHREYAFINDSSHNFRLLTYYIKKESQIVQLEKIGFSDIEMVDESGSFIAPEQECRDGWIYYVCRKSG
jgi:ubiquinone/menaquinone biosynthesis C-methylase UbiE